ncbi:MAG: DUF1573 domain-containing protein [Prevotellaceae bacterium]|nr:DUF1573 domain-containing protein [Prevotellaceae bacterium]
MKYLIILFFILLSLISINLFSQKPNKSGEKSLTFLNRTVNFGNVRSDTLLKAKFLFVNSGTDTVEIEYVNPDCTCTDYSLSSSLINPQDTAFVVLSINTANRYGYNAVYSTVKANTAVKMYKLTMIFNIKD